MNMKIISSHGQSKHVIGYVRVVYLPSLVAIQLDIVNQSQTTAVN